MLLSTHVNKTKIAVAVVALLFAFVPLYFANAFLDGIVYNFVVWFFGGILGLCGAVLNYGVSHFVVGFGQEFNNTTLFNMVNTLWTIVRDFFNLTFIFGLVYLGFMMILNNDSVNTRRWLVSLVIAALLVNFSLLISKIIIDVSNILATQIIVAGLESTPPIFIYSTDHPTEVDFAGSMMQQMKVISVFSSDDTGSYLATAGEAPTDQSLGYSMMLMVLFLVAAFTFFSAGILIIIRGAALLIFMVLSPFMFIGFVIPKLKNKAQEYWTQFLGRAFFAPIYMLMMYISLSVFQAINGANTAVFSEAFNSTGFATEDTMAATFGPFVLLIVLLVASLTVAKQLGVDGATSAIKAGNFARKKLAPRAAGRVTAGTAAFAGRNTVGRGASMLANNRSFQKWAAGNVVGRQLHKGTRAMADGNYDIRNTGVVKGSAKAMGIDVGAGKKGGFDTRAKIRQKKEDAYMDSLSKADMKDPKNIAKGKARAGKIKEDAKKDLDRLKALKAALGADKNKDNVTLKSELKALKAEMKQKKTKLKTDKALTKNDKQNLREEMKADKELSAQKELLIKRNTEIGQAKERALEAEKAKTDADVAVAALAGDPARIEEYKAAQVKAAEFRGKHEKAQEDLAKADSLILEARQEEVEAGLNALGKFVETEKNTAAMIDAHAERIGQAEVEYENRLIYLKDREYNANSFTFLGKGASIPGFTNIERQDSVDSLKKKYGGNAEEMGAKSTRKKTLEEKYAAERKAREDAGVKDGAEKKSAEPKEDEEEDGDDS